MEPITKQLRGFAALSPERRREIASIGGRAAHQQGTAHQFTKEQAVIAGRKGGLANAARVKRKRSFKDLEVKKG